MAFWKHLFLLLPRRPVAALAALYWQLTRRKVRARNRLRVACADFQFAYRDWIAANESKANREAASQAWQWRPSFLVLLHGSGEDSEEKLIRSRRSVERQSYRDWQVGTAIGDIASRLDREDYDYVVPLELGDELAEAALHRFAEALQAHRGTGILYGDQDELDKRGRRSRPWFKPEWNEELFLAQDYLSSAVALEADLARAAAAGSKRPVRIYELVLAAVLQTNRPVVHIPHVLCHVSGAKPQGERLEVVGRYLRRRGASCSAGPFGTVKVNWPLPNDPPLVTIIVPTKDKVALLRPCISSVLERTEYGNFEILIVDNGSVETATAMYFGEVEQDPRVKILRYPGPYNFSGINNFAVDRARGSYICLLNNDTEVIEPAWLSELMRYAIRPDVGAVGAKLLYDNGSIQHAGVVVGIGDAAGHAHRFLPANEPGYFRMPHVAQFVSAVTAACLLIDKEKFLKVGGLDEDSLAVAFNDVDLCLKVEAAGWRNVYVPHAVLFHHESKSRGKDISPENIDRYRRELRVLQERWGTKTYEDPLHNPNLDRYSETFVIAF
jgi:GT2 family glycosyltransferase